ncbi:hypothetical protein KC360_g5955 [Hortaea werneckii]|nr:hypothetical protein KC361_g5941 [Hortaea werneckii]KAI6882185.1 hypothetical protein KC325_g5933 [Hortaea werneckii]KAI6990821.1 hypothetical protein KC359_g6454 [Hortaea werneckii]KAI7081701.1 hypothetical protein KC356_g8943 [Hortaea werneckii]KAI7143899.1 hypothetical protein KC344_g5892 [Hortaea werneckii]
MASDTDAPEMTGPASRRALGIPELLEAMLYHLPFQDLLRAQSVCKRWRMVIDHSKKLQRALYFEPVLRGPVTLCEDPGRRIGYSHWVRAESGERCRDVYENPILSPLIQSLLHVTRTKSLLAQLPECWQRREASWRRMLATQPPFQGAVHIYRHCSPGISNRVLYGQVPVKGIAQCTLGHIVDGMEQQLQAFGGRYLLSCEVPGWLDWQIAEVYEQLDMS